MLVQPGVRPRSFPRPIFVAGVAGFHARVVFPRHASFSTAAIPKERCTVVSVALVPRARRMPRYVIYWLSVILWKCFQFPPKVGGLWGFELSSVMLDLAGSGPEVRSCPARAVLAIRPIFGPSRGPVIMLPPGWHFFFHLLLTATAGFFWQLPCGDCLGSTGHGLSSHTSLTPPLVL